VTPGDGPPSREVVRDGLEISRLCTEMCRRFEEPRQAISGSTVTPRMLAVLRHLAVAGPLTVGEQARDLGIGQATASGVVQRVEAKGLVERMRDERDHRRVFVWLTEAGREQLEALAGRSPGDRFLHAVATLPTATRMALVRGLGELVQAAGDVESSQQEEGIS
jgi:DNA-binding MarR family transcriptional regulator